MSKVFLVITLLVSALLVAILCTRLNTEQELLKVTKLNVQAAEKRLQAAEVELDNALYKQWVYSILWKDVEKKDEWKKEVEELKRDNGFYDE